MIEIRIGTDGIPSQRKVNLCNQYENNDAYIHFDLPQEFDTYHKYVIGVNKSHSKTIVLPISSNNTFAISSQISYLDGTWYLYVMCREDPISTNNGCTDITAIPGEHVFISDGIVGIVNKLMFSKEFVESIPIDTNLKILYNDLLTLKCQLQNIVDGIDDKIKINVGEYIETIKPELVTDIIEKIKPEIQAGADGKSAYEIAVEKGFEGTEEEWLASLDYEHSEEFSNLADQIKKDAESVNSIKENIESLATQTAQYYTQTEEAAQSAIEAAGSATEAAKQSAESAAGAVVSAEEAKKSEANAKASENKAEQYANQAEQAVSGKLDKNQGSENQGKILIVGEDGNVVVGNSPIDISFATDKEVDEIINEVFVENQ